MTTPASMPALPTGYLPRAIWYWTGFHLRRNLRKRAFKLWVLLYVGGLAALEVARAGPVVMAELVMVWAVPLMALFYGAGSLREEIEDQTLTYAFTRPVGRAWTYVARVLAAGLPVALIAVPAAAFIGFGTGEATALRHGLAMLLSTVAFTAFFALVGQLIRWPSWFGLAWLLFWENGVGTVPGFFGRLTVTTHMRGIAGLGASDTPWSSLWSAPGLITGALVLAGVTALALWLGAARARSREIIITR